jgi:hypothetical protein
MKRILLVCLAVALLALNACGGGGDTAPTVTPAPSITPSPTPAPDFSGTDFSGRWHVSAVIDSNGAPLSDSEKEELGAGFTLELLPGGSYFVYDEDGKVLGQGEYAVAQSRLALTAENTETVYEIVDRDTLHITQPDGSVTVMKRNPD